jgi:uncharacterized membrane protein
MENKHVGIIITGIAFVMGIIVLIFNRGMKDVLDQTCSHGATCSMHDTLSMQTWISISLVLILVIVGVVLMFIKPKERIVEKEKIVYREKKNKKKKLDLNGLEKDEKQVIELLQKEGNAMFQADLMEKMEMGKVKTTRLLDKLEAKQFIERKRRGMNNIVVLKNGE